MNYGYSQLSSSSQRTDPMQIAPIKPSNCNLWKGGGERRKQLIRFVVEDELKVCFDRKCFSFGLILVLFKIWHLNLLLFNQLFPNSFPSFEMNVNWLLTAKKICTDERITSTMGYSRRHPSTWSGRIGLYGSSDVTFVGKTALHPGPFASNHEELPVPKFNISLFWNWDENN